MRPRSHRPRPPLRLSVEERDQTMRVSHVPLSTSLFVQSKAVLRTELANQLRTRRVRRRPQRRVTVNGRAARRGRIPDLCPISERPVEVLDRAQPGHWEGDLLVGRYGRSHLVTLVERHSRLLMVLPIADASSTSVVAALGRAFTRLPAIMTRSLTWDRGIEMTRHAEFSRAAGIPVFFCDAYAPWQRGSNENINGLLRQYSPKKTDLSIHTPEQLQVVVASSTIDPEKSRTGTLHARSIKPPPLP